MLLERYHALDKLPKSGTLNNTDLLFTFSQGSPGSFQAWQPLSRSKGHQRIVAG